MDDQRDYAEEAAVRADRDAENTAEREDLLSAMADTLRDVTRSDLGREWAVDLLTNAGGTHDWLLWREASERLGTLDRLHAHSYLLDVILTTLAAKERTP